MWPTWFRAAYTRTVLPMDCCYSSLAFVPKHNPVCDEDVKRLKEFVNSYSKIFVLTGAGISTESGIPDYRSEGVGLYAKSSNRPVQYRDFVRSSAIRKRYWARNYVGWPRFSSMQPNATHIAVQRLEREGKVSIVVTQNVDRLHTKAGSHRVVELHGTSYVVMCLSCNYHINRHVFQDMLSELNPQMVHEACEVRPDGDVTLTEQQTDGFLVPPCPACHGILKPDIVFFGDNVPRQRVDDVRLGVQGSEAGLVLGTSLSVYSSYRIVLQAEELGIPLALVNIGPTRGDHLANLRLEARCGDLLSRLWSNSN